MSNTDGKNFKTGHEEPLSGDRVRISVLVVEDDKTHRSIMVKVLGECGFSVVTAENGLAALARLETHGKFDLILMDLDMPELDGLETVKAIRLREAHGEWPCMPVVAFTGRREPEDREACLAAGMDAYLPKDIWMPRWRQTLIDNLQGLAARDFRVSDFEPPARPVAQDMNKADFDLDEFDEVLLEQTAQLLKNEMAVAFDEYVEDALSYMRQIQQGLEKNDPAKAAKGSHPLKSNSKGFGLMAVSRLAEAINNISRKAEKKEGDLQVARRLFPQLQQAFHRGEQRLRGWMKDKKYASG
ncbi:MAG: response regulator [Alphaproteobacteria bacterium]|nr:response regulator [Alphaproteobacteria bacterium]